MNLDIEGILGSSSFTIIDYVVVGISLGVILLCGVYHSVFSSSSPEHFLVGFRSMSSSPVAVSTAMLYLTALVIIERPAEIYYYGIESLMMLLIMVVIVPVGAILFVPMLYYMQLTSIYQYIGHRFESTVLRCITSLAYILQQLFLTCVILASVSGVLHNYFELPMRTSIIGIGVFTAVITTLGGFRATIWTQVWQYIWITLFLLVLMIVSGSKAGGFLHAFELAAESDRLKLFNLKMSSFMRHNFYNFVFGYGFMAFMEVITYQPMVQRYSSVITKTDALKSMFMSIPLYIIPSLLCLLIGIFLQAAYAGCDPLTLGHIRNQQDIVHYFIRKNLSFVPGFMGFFTACIVGSGICVCSTSIISITACAYQDFISKLGCCKPKKENYKGQAVCCRFLCAVLMALTTVLVYLSLEFNLTEKILPVSAGSNFITFNSGLYGPLAGVLVMAMFLPCINKYGACIGFLTGIGCMGYILSKLLPFGSNSNYAVPPLPPIMGKCPDHFGLNGTFLGRFLPSHPIDVGTSMQLTANMDDIWHISYLLLTLLGAIITIIIGLIVSTLTGGLCFCAGRKVSATMLHPFLKFSDCCVDSESRHLQHAISHRYVDRIASLHNLFPGNSRLESKPPSYKYSSVPNTPMSIK